jgi:hypothetical protein
METLLILESVLKIVSGFLGSVGGKSDEEIRVLTLQLEADLKKRRDELRLGIEETKKRVQAILDAIPKGQTNG